MLIDTRIISQHGAYAVMAHAASVTWPDGSELDLHPVLHRGHEDMFVRALRHQDRWMTFDLRSLARTLAHEIPSMPARDTEGLVLHTLRLAYPSAEACLARVSDNCLDIWTAPLPVHPAAMCEGPALARAALA